MTLYGFVERGTLHLSDLKVAKMECRALDTAEAVHQMLAESGVSAVMFYDSRLPRGVVATTHPKFEQYVRKVLRTRGG